MLAPSPKSANQIQQGYRVQAPEDSTSTTSQAADQPPEQNMLEQVDAEDEDLVRHPALWSSACKPDGLLVCGYACSHTVVHVCTCCCCVCMIIRAFACRGDMNHIALDSAEAFDGVDWGDDSDHGDAEDLWVCVCVCVCLCTCVQGCGALMLV